MKLSWTVTIAEPAPCPDYKPTYNEYTGEVQWPSMRCSVFHCKTTIKEVHRTVSTRADAEQFIRNAPASCSSFFLDGKPLEVRESHRPPMCVPNISGFNCSSGSVSSDANALTGTSLDSLSPVSNT